MTLIKFRVFTVQAFCAFCALALFIGLLELMLSSLNAKWSFLYLMPIICVIAWFVMTACTVSDTEYSSDNFFAVFVMEEKDRQWHFNYTETHPKELNTLGIYNLIGYKTKEI